MTVVRLLEGAMLLCFGASWPFLITKTLRTRNVAGLSIVFLWLLVVGYASGVSMRLIELAALDKGLNPNLFLYAFNGLLVSFEILLYYRYRGRGAPGEILARLAGAKRVLLTGHERTDGDCVGSLVALDAVLRALGKDARVLLPDAPPARYRKLAGFGRIRGYAGEPVAPADLVVVLDSGDRDRLGALANALPAGAAVVNIDHHASNAGWGDLSWVDPVASSVGEMVWRLVRGAGWPLPPEAAEGLYAAIATDTNRFTHPNTTADALRAAADLVEAGADASRLARILFEEQSEASVRLLARALASLALSEGGRVARVTLSAADFAAVGASPTDAHEIVDWPRSIEGVCVAAYLYEIDGDARTRVSLRAEPPLDVARVAARFGGGGHAAAAACVVEGAPSEAWALLGPALRELLA